jgi:hypothetical protein
MSNSRELSKIFTAETDLATDIEMITMVNAASANAMNEAMSYVDSEISVIDLTSTIVTASVAATGYSDSQLNSASTSLTNTINNLTTSDIEEGDNKYFTNQRAIDSGSATYLPYVGGNISGDLTVSGQLTVSGSVTYVSSENLLISDPLLYLGATQLDEDLLDVGFLAAYGSGSATGSAAHIHRGLVFDHTDNKWKLVNNVPHPSSNEVDFSNANFDVLKAGTFEGNIDHTYVVGLSENYEPNIPYNSASPVSAVAGAIWIDSTASATPILKVYNGNAWVEVSGAGGGGDIFDSLLVMGA